MASAAFCSSKVTPLYWRGKKLTFPLHVLDFLSSGHKKGLQEHIDWIEGGGIHYNIKIQKDILAW